ncbi:MAG: hypothetical protein ACJAY8_001391 [Sphingobacteriales bacterium]|jgi:hypothetical protein
MGYMGLGMSKEVYSRKPKKAFSEFKNMYKLCIQKGNGQPITGSELSLQERKRIKGLVRQEIRKKRIRQWSLFVVLYAFVALLIFGAIAYFF